MAKLLVHSLYCNSALPQNKLIGASEHLNIFIHAITFLGNVVALGNGMFNQGAIIMKV